METDRFKLIEGKLERFADSLNASIAKSGSVYSVNGVHVQQDKIEERRIVWIDGSIGKAIIIEPQFDTAGHDPGTWNFFNLAWLDEGPPGPNGKPFWMKYLLRNSEFNVIENNIDQLLTSSKENLSAIKREDLK